MKNIFRIFRRGIKVFWDPYGNTNWIKVSIVNEDSGNTLDGKSINILIKFKK